MKLIQSADSDTLTLDEQLGSIEAKDDTLSCRVVVVGRAAVHPWVRGRMRPAATTRTATWRSEVANSDHLTSPTFLRFLI